MGVAEMLSPLSWDQQPFRFLSLHHDDESRLAAAIQSSRDRDRRDNKNVQRQLNQVENFRAW
jgi:hypothetical protein